MSSLLSALALPSTRRPGLVLATIAALTLVLAVAATNLEMETDLAEFGSDDSEIVEALDRVEADFDRSGAAVQVIVDAGAGGDVLDASGLETLRAVEATIVEELTEQLRRDTGGEARIVSLTGPLDERLEREGVSAPDADDGQVAEAAAEALAAEPMLAALTSQDRDLDAGRARAATALAELDADLSTSERVEATEALQAALGIDEGLSTELGGHTVAVSSPELTNTELENETQEEAPLLLVLALLAVVAILSFLLRSAFDVAVGVAGLVATLAWTFGIIAVAGPGGLDWLGPLSQVGVVVPVLVVGLGIDYAVHLTSRYREQRLAGQGPRSAAGTAVRTVGVALVVATVATAVGFATTAAAPLEVIADFGIFTAIGVVVAFLVMALLVPAAQVLRARRRDHRDGARRDVPVGRLLVGLAGLARRRPVATLAVAAAVLGVSLWGATDLDTQFDRDDFVPKGSDIEALHELQDDLFGGELTETTYVVVDGDLADPELVEALAEAEERVGDVEHVRTGPDGRPQVRSLTTLLAEASRQGAGDGEPPAGAPPGDLERLYDQLRAERGDEVDRFLAPTDDAALVELRTNGGDGGAEQLAEGVREAFSPLDEAGGETSVTSDAMVIAEMAEDLRDFQAQSVVVTLLAVVLLLAGYYGVSRRRPLLGVIAMVPSVTSAGLILGTMALFDVSFDALTATLTAIAVGIGVPYGVHVVNRFTEDHARLGDADAATRQMLRTTGGALAGSALTTFGAFVVLSFSGLALIGRMGLLGAAGIAFALLAAVAIQPSALTLAARGQRKPRDRRAGAAGEPASARLLLLVLADRIRRDAERVEAGGTSTRLLMAAAALASDGGRTPEDPREIARQARSVARTRLAPAAAASTRPNEPASAEASRRRRRARQPRGDAASVRHERNKHVHH